MQMDGHMPELDGFAATAALRREERAPGRERHLPIRALTAEALVGGRREVPRGGD